MTYDIRPASDGGWLALAAGPRLLLVPALDDVHAALEALGTEGGFQAALDLLTGRGLAATPPFVLLERTGEDARIVVRGEVGVVVTDAAGQQPVTASGVATWVERAVTGLSGIAIIVPGARAVGAALPLTHGVVLASEITASALPVALAPTPVVPADLAPSPAGAVDLEATVASPDLDVAPEPSEPAPPATEEGYDYLFGDTVYRSVAEAAVREPEAEEPAAEQPGDHDGHTVLTSDIAKLRAGRKRAIPATVEAPAPQLVLVLSTGAREPLTGPILVGRGPTASKVSGGRIPRLLTVGDGDQDISRNHAQFSVEGGTVVVTDLHSKNGTSIVLPGKPPQRLRAGEPTSVLPGTVVDLGGGVTLTVDED